MSEEQLKELQEYNLEYLEAQQSEEIFGGDYTSAVELKYAKKEIERLNNIINELEKWLDKKEKLTFNSWNKGIHEVQRKLQELKGGIL